MPNSLSIESEASERKEVDTSRNSVEATGEDT